MQEALIISPCLYSHSNDKDEASSIKMPKLLNQDSYECICFSCCSCVSPAVYMAFIIEGYCWNDIQHKSSTFILRPHDFGFLWQTTWGSTLSASYANTHSSTLPQMQPFTPFTKLWSSVFTCLCHQKKRQMQPPNRWEELCKCKPVKGNRRFSNKPESANRNSTTLTPLFLSICTSGNLWLVKRNFLSQLCRIFTTKVFKCSVHLFNSVTSKAE